MFFFKKSHRQKKSLGYYLTLFLILVLVLIPAAYSVITRISSAQATIIPIANWKLDEGYGTTTAETYSNTNTGTLAGTTIPTWQMEDQCVASKCLYFDGTTSKVTVTGSISFKSVSMWVRPISVTAGALADFGSNIRITVASGVLSATGFTSPTIYVDGNPNTTLVANKWQHVTVTSATNVSGSSIQLGAYSTTFLKGYLDDIRMYTDQQTAAIVKGDFTARDSQRAVTAQVGQASTSFLNQGLVGYWKMDETAANSCSGGANDNCDSSGNGNDGAWSGGATTAAAKFARGTTFDGTDDYVDFGDPSSGVLDPGSGSFTYSLWVKPTTNIGSFDMPLNKGGASAGDAGYDIELGSSTWNADISDGTTQVLSDFTFSGTTGEWHLLTAVIDRSSQKFNLYMDGAQVDSDSIAALGAINGVRNLRVGADYNSTFDYNGLVDEVRIYNRALSPAEVRSLYDWAPGPVGYWKLDDNTGTSANDYSTFANTGTITAGSGSWTPGKFGQSYNFDSASTKIDAGSGASLDNLTATPMSLEAWIYPRSTGEGSAGVIMSKNSGTTPSSGWLFQISGTNALTFTVDGSTDLVKTTNSSVLTLSAWNHVAVSWDGVFTTASSVHIYVNGTEVTYATTTNGATIVSDAAQNFIIGNDSTSARTFDGLIDDVKAYNYNRSSSEIVEDMNGTHPTGGSPVGSQVAYWKFDESQGTTVNNSALTTFTTVLSNGPTWSSQANCKINTCLNFDGTDDVLTVTNSNPIDFDVGLNTGVTFSAWINPDTVGEGSAGEIFRKSATTFCKLGGSAPFDLSCSLDESTDATVTVSSVIPASTWTHITMTWSDDGDDEISVYVNGVLRGTSTNGVGPNSADTSDLSIGGGTTNNFDGKIDEFKIYNSELSVDQIDIDKNVNSAVSVSNGSIEGSILTDGLGNPPVAYWQLDDNTGTTAKDTSGTGNTATLTNGPTWSPGKIGGAVTFDGSNDNLTVAVPTFRNALTSFTFSTWVYLNADFNTSINPQFPLVFNLDGQGLYPRISVQGDGNVNVQLRTGGVTQSYSTSTAPVTANTWYHIEVTFDGSNNFSVIYVNGIRRATKTFSAGTLTGGVSGALLMGQDTNIPIALTGKMDEIKIYDYARTRAQVEYDFNRGLPVAWYKMDECTGTTINDGSGNSLTGTWSGATGGNTTAGTCSSGTSTEAWNNGTTGKRNASLDFDGTDDVVTVTNAFPIDADDNLVTGLSYSFWINPATVGEGSAGEVFRKSATTFCKLGGSTPFNLSCSLNLSTDATVTINSQIPASTWTFVTMVWVDDADDEIDIYVNGNLVGSSTNGVGPNSTDSSDLLIGGGTANNFDGKIDDFRMYDYALTTTQMKRLMNDDASARFGPDTGLPL